MAVEKFIDMVERLQRENKGKIILIRNGAFICGIGKDAVIMHNILKYKPTCFKNEICKIGIPVSQLKKTIPKLIETGYSFIVYDYNKEQHREIEIYRIEQEEIEEEKENVECKNCWYFEKRKKEISKYIEELKK